MVWFTFFEAHSGYWVVSASAANQNAMGHLIFTCYRVGVFHILLVGGLAVTEVPMVARDFMASRFCCCGAGQLGDIAFTNIVEVKVGNGFGKDDNIGTARGGLSVNGGDASVGASHLIGAVGNSGILLGGVKSIGACPTISGTSLCGDPQLDSLTNAIGAIVGGDTRKDATVGGTRTGVFCLGECDDARLARVVANHGDIILSSFRHVIINSSMIGLVIVLIFRITQIDIF